MAKDIRAYKIGCKSCILCLVSLLTVTIFNLCTSAIIDQEWQDINNYFINSSKIENVPEIIGLITIPIIIFVISSLYISINDEKKIWGIIIIIFTSMSVLILEISYIIDIGVAFPLLENAKTSDIEMFLMANPNSLTRVLKNFGSFILSIAIFFISYGLNNTRIEKIIKKLCYLCGILGVLYIPNLFIQSKYLESAIVVGYNIVIPFIFFWLSYYFKNKILIHNILENQKKKRTKVKNEEHKSENYYNL